MCENHIVSWLWGGDTHVIDLAGEVHFVKRLLYLAWEIEFEHDRRVGLVVVALAVGPAAGEDIVVEGNANRVHNLRVSG